MSYTPSRIFTIDFETEERVMEPRKVQRELLLISRETDKLQTQINQNEVLNKKQDALINQNTISFSRQFLFLGS